MFLNNYKKVEIKNRILRFVASSGYANTREISQRIVMHPQTAAKFIQELVENEYLVPDETNGKSVVFRRTKKKFEFIVENKGDS